MRARFTALAGLIGLIAALAVAPAASADTATIGAAATPGTLFGGAPNFTVIQRMSDPASPSYAVPQVPAGGGSWSVTSWGALGGTGDGSASLEIWRPTGTPNQFRLITIGPQQPFPTGVLTTHSVNVPVMPGDRLGVLSGPDSDFGPSYCCAPPGDEAIWPTIGNAGGGPDHRRARERFLSERGYLWGPSERSGDVDLDARSRGDARQGEVQEDEEAQALGGVVEEEEVQQAQEEVVRAPLSCRPSWRSPRRDSRGRGATSGARSTRSRPRG